MKIFIETERFFLREIQEEDENGFFELDSDPDVHRYLGNKPVENIEQIRETIRYVRQQYVENRIGRWAIIEKNTNNFIGWTGLKLVKESTNNHINYYDLGYRIIKKYWGKGIATETAKASINYGFTKLLLNDIYATANCDNLASNKILNKVGLRLIETFDLKGVNHNWYTINRNEWLDKSMIAGVSIKI